MGAWFRWLRLIYQGRRALGETVSRATATLPQSKAAAIFNITGGLVLMTSIIGRVTVVIQNIANNTKLTATPTAGTAVDICAVLNIQAYAVGDVLGITGIPTDAMIPAASAGSIPGMTTKGVVLQPGTLDLDCAASATGSVEWFMHYIPLEAASVVAAA